MHSRLNGMQLFAVGFAPMHFAWTQIVPQSIVIGSIFFLRVLVTILGIGASLVLCNLLLDQIEA